jgi:hypothetical protein
MQSLTFHSRSLFRSFITPWFFAPVHASLKLGERLDSLAGSGQDTENVETNRLGEGSALAHDDLVTGLDTEGGGHVCGEVLVALLVAGVLGDEVEVFAPDD